MENDRPHLVALTAIDGIGSATIFRLISTLKKHEMEWDGFWALKVRWLEHIGLSEKQINSIKNFKKEHTPYSYLEWLDFRNIRAVVFREQEYPPMLRNSRRFPAVLFAKGRQIVWKKSPTIAIVGTRNMTSYGQQATTEISAQLARCGCRIVSGGMYGVDATAHQACLEVGGTTVAILGYGFEHVYPSSHLEKHQKWLAMGMTFFSPFAPNVAPKRGNFPARNQLVACSVHAVVVTEAAERSGSLITAEFAAQEGRSVCAIPGPFNNPYTAGTKDLLNQGATLVTSAGDVLNEVARHFPDIDV